MCHGQAEATLLRSVSPTQARRPQDELPAVPGSGPQREEACLAPGPSQGSPGRQGSTLPSSVCLSCCFSFGRPGYVVSVMGRRRHLPRIRERDPQLRAQAERQAVNFVVQGAQSPRLARRVHLLLGCLAAAGPGDTRSSSWYFFPLSPLAVTVRRQQWNSARRWQVPRTWPSV